MSGFDSTMWKAIDGDGGSGTDDGAAVGVVLGSVFFSALGCWYAARAYAEVVDGERSMAIVSGVFALVHLTPVLIGIAIGLSLAAQSVGRALGWLVETGVGAVRLVRIRCAAAPRLRAEGVPVRSLRLAVATVRAGPLSLPARFQLIEQVLVGTTGVKQVGARWDEADRWLLTQRSEIRAIIAERIETGEAVPRVAERLVEHLNEWLPWHRAIGDHGPPSERWEAAGFASDDARLAVERGERPDEEVLIAMAAMLGPKGERRGARNRCRHHGPTVGRRP